ncbi:hypothetical protein PAMA_015753 [Pampus argenteus]
MMWSVVIVLAAALRVESFVVRDLHERLVYGRQLKIYLPKNVEKLEFTPADNPIRTMVYWEKNSFRTFKGRVSGTSSDRRWYIDKVTYDDQGTYTQKDFWNKELSIVKVAVIPKHNYQKCLAGETLYIHLEGLALEDAVLSFSGENANVTLVRDGARVSQDLPDYWDRVWPSSRNIEIRHVNYSDVGYYTLKDRKDRLVSVTRMDLTDKKVVMEANPLLALLLLLGIPAGICCCCRKKIFKKKATTAATLQTTPVHPPPSGPIGSSPPYSTPGQPGATTPVHPPPSGPIGSSPPYSTPGQPGAVYYHGNNPGMGFNPVHPPQNPAYPPAGPAMIPPAQPPQWNGPQPGLYPPGPAAPMGYSPAPVMYSSPPPTASEPVKMENTLASPTDPLLTSAPQTEAPAGPVPPSSANAPGSSEGTYQFQINGDPNKVNFL